MGFRCSINPAFIYPPLHCTRIVASQPRHRHAANCGFRCCSCFVVRCPPTAAPVALAPRRCVPRPQVCEGGGVAMVPRAASQRNIYLRNNTYRRCPFWFRSELLRLTVVTLAALNVNSSASCPLTCTPPAFIYIQMTKTLPLFRLRRKINHTLASKIILVPECFRCKLSQRMN